MFQAQQAGERGGRHGEKAGRMRSERQAWVCLLSPAT